MMIIKMKLVNMTVRGDSNIGERVCGDQDIWGGFGTGRRQGSGGRGGVLKGQLLLLFAERAQRALLKVLISVVFTNISWFFSYFAVC